MPMLEIPKNIKKQLNKLAALAWERELRRELDLLAQRFDAWRAGQIDSWELTDLIHKYHNGPARELWKVYNNVEPRFVVASALARGIIRREEITDQVWPWVEGLESFFEASDDNDEDAPKDE